MSLTPDQAMQKGGMLIYTNGSTYEKNNQKKSLSDPREIHVIGIAEGE